MSDQTTIATIIRALVSVRQRIGPHAQADYALGLLVEDLKEAQTPAHLKVSAGGVERGSEVPAAIALMAETLTLCAATFDHYAELHRTKGTEEGNRKADANLEMARLCRVALGVEPARPAL
jgi:hypothetical protein